MDPGLCREARDYDYFERRGQFFFPVEIIFAHTSLFVARNGEYSEFNIVCTISHAIDHLRARYSRAQLLARITETHLRRTFSAFMATRSSLPRATLRLLATKRDPASDRERCVESRDKTPTALHRITWSCLAPNYEIRVCRIADKKSSRAGSSSRAGISYAPRVTCENLKK